MLFDVWKTGSVPTRREQDEKRAREAAKSSQPQDVPGKPGFTLVGGRLKYNPWDDPQWQRDLDRLGPDEDRHHQEVIRRAKQVNGDGWSKKVPAADQPAAFELPEARTVGVISSQSMQVVLAGPFGNMQLEPVDVDSMAFEQPAAKQLLDDVNNLLRTLWGASGYQDLYGGEVQVDPLAFLVASGQCLDRLANMHGLYRDGVEPDDMLRARVLQYLTTPPKVSWQELHRHFGEQLLVTRLP